MADYTTFSNGEPSDRAAGSILMSIPGAGTYTAYYNAANRALQHGDFIRIGLLPAGTVPMSGIVRSKVAAAGDSFRLELREAGTPSNVVELDWSTPVDGSPVLDIDPATPGYVAFMDPQGVPLAKDMELWLRAAPGAGLSISAANVEIEFGIFAHLTE